MPGSGMRHIFPKGKGSKQRPQHICTQHDAGDQARQQSAGALDPVTPGISVAHTALRDHITADDHQHLEAQRVHGNGQPVACSVSVQYIHMSVDHKGCRKEAYQIVGILPADTLTALPLSDPVKYLHCFLYSDLFEQPAQIKGAQACCITLVFFADYF